MYPFTHILESDGLMSSHCLFKAFDEVPSTLSKVLLTDVLRGQIGYEGLIISDGMEMKAITVHYGIGKGSVMALNAGCDILLLCHDYNEQKEAFDTVKKAVEDGEISVELLREKAERINKAKAKIADKMKANFTDGDYVVVDEEHALMQSIVDNSYTLIKGNDPKIDADTLVISSNVRVASIAEDEFDERNLTKALKASFPENEVIQFTKDLSFTEEVLEKAQRYGKVLVYSYDAYNDDVQKGTINALLKSGKEVYVVSIKGPIDRQYFQGLANYACLYEYTPNSIRSIVKQLKGEIALNGKIPE